jgi:pyoverdine/dityrosine biosynthesis protein Dit1
VTSDYIGPGDDLVAADVEALQELLAEIAAEDGDRPVVLGDDGDYEWSSP